MQIISYYSQFQVILDFTSRVCLVYLCVCMYIDAHISIGHHVKGFFLGGGMVFFCLFKTKQILEIYWFSGRNIQTLIGWGMKEGAIDKMKAARRGD